MIQPVHTEVSLVPGTRLGPYGVTAQIGVGGIGEVYHIKAPKLDRDVAHKVLPESLDADPDRLGRFQCKAEVLVSLNRPNRAERHELVVRSLPKRGTTRVDIDLSQVVSNMVMTSRNVWSRTS